MNYIKKNCELLEKNLEEYIKGLNSNYVVMENDTPLTWESDGTPAIFGGKEDAEECIENFEDNSNLRIITELEYLCKYDKDILEEVFKALILKYGENDGVCTIFFLNNMNNVINLNDGMYTDILNVGVGVDGRVSMLISSEDDMFQTFEDIYGFDCEIIEKMLNQIIS